MPSAFYKVDNLVCAMRRKPIQKDYHGFMRPCRNWQYLRKSLKYILLPVRALFLHLCLEPRWDIRRVLEVAGDAAILLALEEREDGRRRRRPVGRIFAPRRHDG